MPLVGGELAGEEIARLIPHSGSMVMLDRVVDWHRGNISCWTEAHLRLDNPLRRDGILPAVAGIEIAGQAMAVHGRLISEGPQRKGLLGGLRDIRLNVSRLDDLHVPLVVDAQLLGGNSGGRIYLFKVCADLRILLEGRASVFSV